MTVTNTVTYNGVCHNLADNALTTTANSSDINNTNSPITVTLATGTGALMPLPKFWVTIYLTDPSSDTLMEIAECIGISGDVLTLNRPNPQTHVGIQNIGILDTSKYIQELQNAIISLQTPSLDDFLLLQNYMVSLVKDLVSIGFDLSEDTIKILDDIEMVQ